MDYKTVDDLIVRSETPADIDAITEVTLAAFTDHPISNMTEHFIVLALREAGALTVSLVAEIDGCVFGHVAFSPVTISDGTTDWYGLGPVSVLPAMQKRGIGQALIKEGVSLLRQSGGRGCVLVGDPGYYKRLGFENFPQLVHEGVPPDVFLAMPFDGEVPEGVVVFHEGFRATGESDKT